MKVRRIVTGTDPQGRSVFTSDEQLDDVFGGGGMEGFREQGSLSLVELWKGVLPSDNSAISMREGAFELEPDPGTLMVRIATFPPEPDGTAKPGQGVDSHPGFHITDTTDIISGREGEV